MAYKKVIFSAITLPIGYNTAWAYGWQKRRMGEKKQEVDRRIKKISNQPEDIRLEDLKFDNISEQELYDNILFRPFRIKGVFNHQEEIMVQRPLENEKGFMVMTPLVTQADQTGNETKFNGIFV